MYIKENYVCHKKNLLARVRFSGYLQRKKGTHFLTNYMGYLMLQKVENTLGFIMISGQGFQGKQKIWTLSGGSFCLKEKLLY